MNGARLDNFFSAPEVVHLKNTALIKVSGVDSTHFLQGQFTCDMSQVSEKKATLGALCSHQGRVLAIFYLFKKQEAYYCFLPTDMSDLFITHLSKFAQFSQVTLENISDDYFIYGCCGKACTSLLAPAFKAIPTQPYEQSIENNRLLSLLPGSLPRYLIFGNKPLTAKATTSNNIKWRLSGILSGYATIYTTTSGLVTPHMLNLDALDAISFNKGCYVGQEIIARTHYRGKSKRHLYRAEISQDVALTPGEKIYEGDQEVGLVMDAASVDNITIMLAVLQDTPSTGNFTVRTYGLENSCKI
jgi:tRNA-modifying protein YgfZ